jgi:hypothetical protein
MDAKINLYIKILITHIVLYYTVVGAIVQSLMLWDLQWPISWEFMAKILFSPLAGILGLYDDIPAFFLLPFFLLIFLVECKNLPLYRSYVASVLVAYVVVKFFLFSICWHQQLGMYFLQITLVSIFISSMGVRFLLKKHFTV